MCVHHVYATKVLVVPFSRLPGGRGVTFLCVKDRRFSDWTFISGTCKTRVRELPERCAVRELREETKRAVCIPLKGYQYKRFVIETDFREPHERRGDEARNRRVTTRYHVFLVDITGYKPPGQIMREFALSTPKGKQYYENSELCFMTLEQFKSKQVWRFIGDVVLRNHTFNQSVRDIVACL